MLVNIKILNRPETRTVNGHIYEETSYNSRINEYINDFGGAVYSYNNGQYNGTLPIGENNPLAQIGIIKSYNDDFTFTVDIQDNLYELIKDDVDSYYIMIRAVVTLLREGNAIRVRMLKVLGMDLHNDPKNITKLF